MKEANIRRLADAAAHQSRLWDSAKRFIIDIRQQMPGRGAGTHAKPFPSIPQIVESLRSDGFETAKGGPINYNTVARLLDRYFDEWSRIPSSQDAENNLPAPPVTLLGRFRLLEDVGHFSAGEYGQIIEIGEDNIVASFTDWDSIKTEGSNNAEHVEMIVHRHQIRMVETNLEKWFER